MPLVLVHGLATTRVIWRRVLPLLEEREVVAIDVPGFGSSPPAGPGFDLGAVADRVLEGLDVPRPFDLVGHSMGGAVALTLAAREPQAVRRLVLVAPAGLRAMSPRAARAVGVFASRAIPVRRRGAPLADTRWGRRLLMSPGTADPVSLPPGEVRAMLAASHGATRIAEALSSVAASDLRPLLASPPVPVGVLWGARDRIIPPVALPDGVPIETIEDAGHIPMMERPEAFAAALERMLSRVGNNVAPPAA